MIKIAFWIAGGIAFLLVTQSGNGIFENMMFMFVFVPLIASALIWLFANLGFEDSKPKAKAKKPAYQVDDWLDPGVTRRHR